MHTYVYMYTCLNCYTCIHNYIYICIYTYTHIHIYGTQKDVAVPPFALGFFQVGTSRPRFSKAILKRNITKKRIIKGLPRRRCMAGGARLPGSPCRQSRGSPTRSGAPPMI